MIQAHERFTDLLRAIYHLLIFEWLRYLKGSYDYLFSLAVRTSPFDPGAEVLLKQD